MFTRKKLVFMLGLVIVVLLGVIIFLELQKKLNPPVVITPEVVNPYVPNDGVTSSAPRDWEETAARKEVPAGVQVPEMNEVIPENLKNEIAVPVQVIPVAVNADSQIRLFKVNGVGGKFVPEKIIANFKDTVHIEITAVDQDYNFIIDGYNLEQNVSMGQTKSIEFQASQDGRFPYYCSSCGGSITNPQGEVIIVK
jgi:heme/copper-type cytochrome/quinol oxidase subunit 2